MRVVFRVDASTQIGSGHTMRCLTLADALRKSGAQCHFICREHSGHLLGVIRQNGFAVTVLPLESPLAGKLFFSEHLGGPAHASWLGCDWQSDAEQSVAILAALQPDWLVVDHYGLDLRWEAALRPHCGRLMVIDDLADRPHECDLLLDQNLGRQREHYAHLVPPHCKVMAGPRYALLRPEFAALRAYSLRRRQKSAVRHVLVTMGGVDQPNATCQVLRALKGCGLPDNCRISVVMGQQAQWLQQVQEEAQSMPRPTEVLVNISDMAQRMADSDFAIGAAGSTSWERCCLGLPTLMVVLADNQRAIAEAIQGAGAAKTMSTACIAPIVSEVFSGVVANGRTLQEMSCAAASIVDGLGAVRIVSYLSVKERS